MKMQVTGTLVAIALCGWASAARADAVFSFAPLVVGAPDSRGFSNSGPAGGSLAIGTLATNTTTGQNFNFLDTWNFTLGPNAYGGGFVGTLNWTDQAGNVITGIQNLQLRLVGPTGPSSATLVHWQSGVLNFPGGQQVISLIPTSPLLSGDYQMQVRGLLTGPAYSYSGTLQTTAVPLPPALPLMAAGLITLVSISKRRRPEG